MRRQPTALGWINLDVSIASEWDVAQLRRLARRLGYVLIWPDDSPIRLVDQVRNLDVDIVLAPAPNHLDALELDAVMHVTGIETACPRMSFNRWMQSDAGT